MSDPAQDGEPAPARVNYGRQGSPTVTVALPFSTVRVTEGAEVLDTVAELCDLVARLAEAATGPRSEARDELAEVAERARELRDRLAEQP